MCHPHLQWVGHVVDYQPLLLDSHANMPVVGRESLIVEQSGKTVEVSPFTTDYKPIKVDRILTYGTLLDVLW